MLSSRDIVAQHDHQTRAWHLPEDALFQPLSPRDDNTFEEHAPEASSWLDCVTTQHRANFDLWHIEDEARTPGASDAEIAAVKRRVDQTNQIRNDLAEGLDRTLLGWLKAHELPNPDAKLNSESPGLIIDRLSILALKIFHTREECLRADADANHIARNQSRLAILEEQRADLARCLDELWEETVAGTRRFKLYRQLKMYNDSALNPSIYRKIPKE